MHSTVVVATGPTQQLPQLSINGTDN